MNCLEARQIFIHELTRDAEAHEARRYQDIGAGFDQVDAELPRDEGPEFDKLFIALDFWDGWIDARNHDWQYYKGIKERDWPRLARTIIKALEADQEITDPLVLSHFDFRNPRQSRGLIRRLLDKISG
jgi:hypothetical protein